jgi:hypothetical protein
MKTFMEIILCNESADKIVKSISSGIYKRVFADARTCRDIDSFQCHCSVEWVKENLGEFWWHKEIEYILWDERKWKEVSEKLLSDRRKFKNRRISELVEDIADFSVNGHSTMKFRGYYVDPYLKSLKVPEKSIQQFGKYWESIVK